MLKNWKYNTFSKYLEVHKKNYIESYVATFIHHCIIVSWEKQWSRDLKLKVFWDIWSRFWNKGFRPSLSCWRTIPHYNLVIIIELSVVNVGNFTTTLLYEIWNFFEFFGTVLLFAKFIQHFFVILYHPRLPKQKSCAIYLQKVWFKHFRD